MFNKQTVKLIKESPFACVPPWTLEWLLDAVRKLPKNAIVVELGTFVGGTTRFIANANADVFVHSIDLNNFEVWEGHHMLLEMQRKYDIPDLRAKDLAEVQRIHVEDFSNITLHTGPTTSLDIDKIDLAFIDAGHSEEDVLRDLEFIWPRVKEKGLIFGDDADDYQVYNAFVKFAKRKNIPLTTYSKFAKITKLENGLYERDLGFQDTIIFEKI